MELVTKMTNKTLEQAVQELRKPESRVDDETFISTWSRLYDGSESHEEAIAPFCAAICDYLVDAPYHNYSVASRELGHKLIGAAEERIIEGSNLTREMVEKYNLSEWKVSKLVSLPYDENTSGFDTEIAEEIISRSKEISDNERDAIEGAYLQNLKQSPSGHKIREVLSGELLDETKLSQIYESSKRFSDERGGTTKDALIFYLGSGVLNVIRRDLDLRSVTDILNNYFNKTCQNGETMISRLIDYVQPQGIEKARKYSHEIRNALTPFTLIMDGDPRSIIPGGDERINQLWNGVVGQEFESVARENGWGKYLQESEAGE